MSKFVDKNNLALFKQIYDSSLKTIDGQSIIGTGDIKVVDEYDSLSLFPATGTLNTLYIATDTNKQYRWDGSAYAELSTENAIEVVEYQTTTPLTSEQIEKAKAGKLCVYYQGYMCFYQGGNSANLSFSDIGINPESGEYVPWQISLRHVVIQLNLASGLLSVNEYERTCITDSSGNVFDASTAPVANGKRLVREMNVAGKLLPSISGSTDANKIVNVNSSYTGYELNDVKTINGNSILGTGDIDTSETVAITSLGVQSDEMAAKIETAKSLYYDDYMYTRYGTTTVQVDTNPGTANVTAYVFRRPMTVGSSLDLIQGLTYIPYNKTLQNSPNTGTGRVSGIGPMFGSAYGHINLDNSLQVSKSGTGATMSLTGNVPYATTEPESDNVDGFMKIVVLDHEPAEEDRHKGYMYMVTGSGGADVNELYVSSTTISSGDNLNTTESDLLNAMLAHRPVEFNDVRCSFQADDGTNVQYSNMTLNGAYLHVNMIVVAKSTGIVTFNTFNIGDTATAI